MSCYNSYNDEEDPRKAWSTVLLIILLLIGIICLIS